MRPFGCPVTILNTIDHLGKFDGKADKGFFVRYSLNSKAFRVFNSRTRIVEENLNIRFSESTPNVVGSGLDWLFDIDALTRTMNYEPIVEITFCTIWPADPPYSQDSESSQDDGSNPLSDDGKKVDEDPTIFNTLMLWPQIRGDEDDGAVVLTCNNLDTTIKWTQKGNHALKDPKLDSGYAGKTSTFQVSRSLDFGGFTKWKNGYRVMMRYVMYVNPGLKFLDFPNRVYNVEKALYGLHQALTAWYETLSYLLDMGFKRIFGFTESQDARHTMETQNPLLKDKDGEEVDVHMYRSMIGSSMYLTSSMDMNIMFAVEMGSVGEVGSGGGVSGDGWGGGGAVGGGGGIGKKRNRENTRAPGTKQTKPRRNGERKRKEKTKNEKKEEDRNADKDKKAKHRESRRRTKKQSRKTETKDETRRKKPNRKERRKDEPHPKQCTDKIKRRKKRKKARETRPKNIKKEKKERREQKQKKRKTKKRTPKKRRRKNTSRKKQQKRRREEKERQGSQQRNKEKQNNKENDEKRTGRAQKKDGKDANKERQKKKATRQHGRRKGDDKEDTRKTPKASRSRQRRRKRKNTKNIKKKKNGDGTEHRKQTSKRQEATRGAEKRKTKKEDKKKRKKKERRRRENKVRGKQGKIRDTVPKEI
ncbi:hypothetical protein Tco_1315637 [Tanacetum coccineum]